MLIISKVKKAITAIIVISFMKHSIVNHPNIFIIRTAHNVMIGFPHRTSPDSHVSRAD